MFHKEIFALTKSWKFKKLRNGLNFCIYFFRKTFSAQTWLISFKL